MLPHRAGRRYILLDRDGTINVDKSYLSDPARMELLPGAVQGLKLLQDNRLGLVIVTNQSGLSRGYFHPNQLENVHRRLRDLLLHEGIRIDGIYYCPHAPDDNCFCRKPHPGLVYQAAAELRFDPCESFVVGDKPCDIEMGRRVGATTVMVCTAEGATAGKKEAETPDFVVKDLAEAAAVILKLVEQPCEQVQADKSGQQRRRASVHL